MAIDFSPLSRIKSVGEFDQERQARQMNALQLLGAQQKADEYSRGVERQNALRALTTSWNAGTTDDQRLQGLKNAGYFNEADALEKTLMERQKTNAGVAETKAKTAAQEVETKRKLYEYGIQSLQTAETPEQAAAFINGGVNAGHWDMNTASKMIQGMQADPSGFEMWRRKQLRSITSAKDQLPTFETRNLGGTTDTLRRDPITGQVAVANSAQNTQSPDNAASNARMAADAAAARAQSERHFNTTQGNAAQAVTYQQDASGNFVALPTRVAPGTTVKAAPVLGGDGKPVAGKPAGGGQATEDERKSAGYAIRMEDALQTLAKVQATNPSATRPGVRESATNMLPEGLANYIRPEDRQRVEAAQLDALDAALTLATGAAYTKEQLKGLSRAYFAQPGDADTTVAEKQARLQKVIETARVRAGRAAPSIDQINNPAPTNPSPKPTGKPSVTNW